ncbi:hypothetical protein C8J56DRAFT_723422, partial [Mycena floridula]
MWLKSYLNLGENRATWAYFADAIIARHANSGAMKAKKNEDMKINMFLQSWKATNMSGDLGKMVQAAKDLGVRLEGIAISRETMEQMPIWFHKEADPKIRRLNHSKESQCLRKEHKVITVGDTMKLALALEDTQHRDTESCECNHCCGNTRDSTHCMNPSACFKKARQLLECLPQKWNPWYAQPEDLFPLAKTGDMLECDKDTEYFDRESFICKGSISNAFRVFTTGEVWNGETYFSERRDVSDIPEVVYTDGSCIDNGNQNARAGAGIWFEDDSEINPRSISLRIPESLAPSNQSGELLAVKAALEEAQEQRVL